MKWRALECVLVFVIFFTVVRLFPDSAGTTHYFSPVTLESKYRPGGWLTGWMPTFASGEQVKPSPLADYLVEKGYWVPARVTRPRWIVTGHFSTQWTDGQTALHYPLYWHHEKWIAWTEAHPEIARIVWPQFLASIRREERLGGMIELLWIAEHVASVDDLRRLVQKSEAIGDELKKSIANAVE